MNNSIKIDIQFYNQYQTFIKINTNLIGEEKRFSELILFSSYALRQMHNLRNIALPLAQVLYSVKPPFDSHYYYSPLLFGKSIQELAFYVPVINALGVDIKELIPFMTAFRTFDVAPNYSKEQISKYYWPNSPEIVNQQNIRAKKRFMGELKIKDKLAFFELTTKGFGIFGEGVNYYAPVSVALLLSFLENIHRDSYLFSNQLAKVANLCGSAFLNNRVTIRSQIEMPYALVTKVINEVTQK